MLYSLIVYCSGYKQTLIFSPNTSDKIKNQEAKEFSTKQCNDLFAAVLVHDDCYLEAKLPEKIHLDYSAEQLRQCFLICKQIWQQGVDRKVLIDTIIKISRQRHLSEDEQLNYKHARAKFKHLRFAFVICERTHRYPRFLHFVTSVMGNFQDAFKNHDRALLFRSAFLLRILLSGLSYNLIVRELEGFVVSEPASFQQHIIHQINFLRTHLAKREITSEQFHEMRKVISRQVALYDNLKILFPSTYHNNISEYLSTINGLMGSMHDDLIVKKFEKSQNYYTDTFVMPKDIKQRLLSYVDKY